MKTGTITCPSGLTFVAREILIKDQGILTNKRAIRTGEIVDQILGACWQETLEPGPYGFTGRPAWGDVLQGDRLVALVKIRALTHGDAYEFRTRCPDCRRNFDYRVSIEADLPIQPLPEESLALLAAGADFHVTVDDVDVGFRLLTGKDERRLRALLEGAGNEKLSTTLAYRIRSIAGVPDNERGKWIKSQGLGFLRQLLAAFDAADCGIDTDIEIECPFCDVEVQVKVPFDEDFLMPETKRKKARPDPSG